MNQPVTAPVKKTDEGERPATEKKPVSPQQKVRAAAR